MYRVTKHYGHEQGLSCAFRQWRAKSHCRLIHGYALAFTFVFEATELDACNWVVDFGGLKDIKGHLIDLFDHRMAVAVDDPEAETLRALENLGVVKITWLTRVGCEYFAELGYQAAETVLADMAEARTRVSVVSCTCAEHSGNSATYTGDE